MSKILIIGGAGLIGSAIAKYHLSKNDEVYIIDNKSNKFNDYLDFENEKLGIDVTKIPLNELFLKHEFDIISHQAASVGVGESQYEIKKYINNNVGYTAELLQAIVISKRFPKKLILASSMGPYGEGLYECATHGKRIIKKQRDTVEIKSISCCGNMLPIPNHEDIERYPQSIYGTTKLMQEEMFRVFAETYNTPTIALRYFSVYGTECNPNNPFTGVLSIIANKIINNHSVDLNEDGTQTRDLIHADDIAEVHHIVSNKKLDNIFEYFNIATGASYALKDIATEMIKILAPDRKLLFNKRMRKGDIKNSFADINKAKQLLEWEAKIKLPDSIIKYCEFVKNNWNKYKTPDTCQKEQEKLYALNLLK